MSTKQSLFAPATNNQAFLKAGIMGFAGDGKTYTATLLAIGMVQLMRERGLPMGDKPVMFLDTETGADWVQPRFAEANVPLHTAKTRAFTDLLMAVDQAEADGSLLLIDSVTHFWRNITEEYAEARGRKSGLQFQDWAWLKMQWGRFTDRFVNSQLHIIMCGRAGYEYDFFEQEGGGKKELQKTGVKMKAETETGYEPSILLLMEKHREMQGNEMWHTATVLKDRSTRLHGKTIRDPSFEDFRPHIDFLNLGGTQIGVDSSRTSAELFADDGEPNWKYEKRIKEIALDEILQILEKHHHGTSAVAKTAKADLVEKLAGTRSWERVKSFSADALADLRNKLWIELEGTPYEFVPPTGQADPKDDPDLDKDVPQ